MNTTKLAGVRRMKRVATAAMAGLVVLAGLVGASPAQADGYSVDLTIKSVVKNEGQTYKLTAKATPAVDCDWTLKAPGKTVTEEDGGGTISHTFTAPNVSHDTVFDSKVTCKYSGTDPAFPIPEALGFKGGALGFATAVAPPVHTVTASGTVTVLQKGGNHHNGNGHHKKHGNKDDDDDNGNLPNTGGERLAWLVIGLLLVAAGSTVVVSSRKRDSVV